MESSKPRTIRGKDIDDFYSDCNTFHDDFRID